ncbi:MAG: polysaccharide deacetylase family protein [Spongiibacteraceae bacterium]
MPIKATRKKILFLLSVDTEEEFDWNGSFPQHDCTVENIQRLPKFQQFCDSLGIRPTYLVDYPVAANHSAAAVLKNIHASNNAEIGAHLHPWCTPPIEGGNGEKESHVINLPIELVKQKLDSLTRTIRENIGVTPTVFRTGRWGINSAVLKLVSDAGYTIDSSMYPYYSNEYFSCEHSHNKPYWPDFTTPDKKGSQRQLFELPITSGFNRAPFRFWAKVHRLLSRPGLELLHPVGLAWRTNSLRKLFLSPELSSSSDMIALATAAISADHPVIHMFLHSSTLLPGQNEFTQTEEDTQAIYMSIKHFINHLTQHADVSFCTLSEAAAILTNPTTKTNESTQAK